MVTKRSVRRISAAFLGLLITLSFSCFWTGVPTVHAAPDHTVTVTGRFTFAGGEPIRGAYVEVYDSDVEKDDLKATGYTDENGYYYITGVDNVDWTYWGPTKWEYGIPVEWGDIPVTGIDVYVKCYAENGKVRVMGNPDWMPWTVFEGGTYRFNSEKKDDVDDGSTVDLGTQDAPTDEDEAFNVFDTINKAYDFLASIGFPPPQVKAYWDDSIFQFGIPRPFVTASFYFPRSIPERASIPDAWAWLLSGLQVLMGTLPTWIIADVTLEAALRSEVGIHLRDGDGWDESTVLHEYGHYVMDYFADFWPPDTVLTHYRTTAYNPQHALGEGWADFFSAAVRQWAGYSVSQYRDNPEMEGKLDQYGVLKTPVENYQGDSVEASIAGIFWDILDDQNEPGDEHAWGFYPMWDVLLAYDPDPASSWPDGKDHPWDIYDFFNGFLTRHPEQINGIWSIYKLHGIVIPDYDPPSNPTSYTSSHTPGVWSSDNTIDISWSVAYDALSGVKEYSFVWDTIPTTIPDTIVDVTGTSTTSYPLSDGDNWYFHVRAKDRAGNWADGAFHVGPFYLDNTPPTTTLTIGEPKYISDKIYVTPDTPFTLSAADTGSGVYSTAYRIRSATYDSGWLAYTTPFHLTSLTDGAYTIEYNSTDNVKNTETANAITVTLFSWNYVFEDTYGRGTILKINLARKFFQFIAPDKDYGIREASTLYIYRTCLGTAVVILHEDSELILFSKSVGPPLDVCAALAFDKQTHKQYWLIDAKPG